MTSHTETIETPLPITPDVSDVPTAVASDDGQNTDPGAANEAREYPNADSTSSASKEDEASDVSVAPDGQTNVAKTPTDAEAVVSADLVPPIASPIFSDEISKDKRTLSPIPDASEGESDAGMTHKAEHGRPATSASITSDPFQGLTKKVSFHTDGELFVKVREGESLVLYEVCAANLAAASPVWRRMIYGGKHPCPAEGPWIIELLGDKDDAFGLDVIFSIAHYKYHQIRERYVVSELYGIALVADWYDCTPMLVPWMKEWMAGLYYNVVMNNGHNDNDKTLFVAWVFGDAERLSKVIDRCAHRATIGKKRGFQGLLDANGRPWVSYGLPKDIIKTIEKVRGSTINKLIKTMAAPMEYLMKPGIRDAASKFKFCRAMNDSDAIRLSCEHLQLGSALSDLISRGLHPSPKPDEWTGSAENLAEAYRSIEVTRYKVPGARPHQDDHRSCGFDHAKTIEDIMDAPVKLSVSVVAQLKRQALRCGGYKEQVFLQLDRSTGDAQQVAEELRSEYPSLFKKVVMLSNGAGSSRDGHVEEKRDAAEA